MHDADKTQTQLINELEALRLRLSKLENIETTQKQTEAALQASEAQFRHLMDGSVQGVFLHTQGVIRFANTAMARIFGYDDPTDLVGQDYRIIVAPVDRERVEGYRQARLRQAEAPTQYEIQGMQQDGSFIWLECLVSVVSWEGEPAVMSTFVDITARKQAEAALQDANERLERRVAERTADLHQAVTDLQKEISEREYTEAALRHREAQYRTLVETMPHGVQEIDTSGRITFNNPAHARMLGDDKDSLLGVPIWDFLPSDDEKIKLQAYLETLVRNQPPPTPYFEQKQTRDGRLIDVQVDWNYKRDEDDRLIGFIAIISDITERQRLEAQLRQSQKMEAIGTLAGGIAHEFNNILWSILGFTDLAQDETPSDSPVWSYLQEVRTAGHRAKDLVQKILMFSRQQEHARQPLSASRMVQDVLSLLRATLPSTIEIREHLADPEGAILADPTQMNQILVNLCANAEYAMRPAGGVLEIGVEVVEVDETFVAHHPHLHPGPHVRMWVRDTGPGMMANIVERIFDPFFTTKDVGEGAGMGLAIVHGIVVSHDGAIAVESAPGEGATFNLYFPCTQRAVVESRAVQAGVGPTGSGRVLFVDDEPALGDVAAQILKKLGYQARVSTSGRDALDLFQADPQGFDLVITDQTMPHMTGEQLALELRRIRPDIPIMLCTGYSHVIDAEKAREIGIDAFCMKPLTTRDLAVAVRQLLGEQSQDLT